MDAPRRPMGTRAPPRRAGAPDEALRARAASLRTMADHAPVLIWIAGTDARRVDINEPWLEFTGRTWEQEAGEGWMEGVHPDDRERRAQAFRSAFAARQPFSVEYRLRRHDGVYRWLLENGVPLAAPNGAFDGYIGSCIDITDRKRAEEEQARQLCREQEARAAAEAANRARDDFLSLVSHELRTPLTPILGYSQLLRQKTVSAATLARALEAIDRGARTQARLVSDLLDISRIITGTLRLEPEPTDLTVVTTMAVNAIRPAAEAKGLMLTATLPSGAVSVLGDPDRLRQVLSNLLDNAVKFTPPGGAVTVRLRRTGGNAEITVADTGAGIAADVLPCIFDSFRRDSPRRTHGRAGLGLGLAIVRHLAELHGGTVSAASEGEGCGATFTVRLPLSPS